jgi:predicted enzyme related to lactoylglutathione lyase
VIISSYLEILTNDLARSVKWYQDNFGFEVSVNNGENFAMLMIAPGVPFFINKASGEITRNLLFHGGHLEEIGFIADDMDNLHQQLKDNGTDVNDLYKDGEHWNMYLHDPDGNKICIWSGK